jgi:hypothetical protein
MVGGKHVGDDNVVFRNAKAAQCAYILSRCTVYWFSVKWKGILKSIEQTQTFSLKPCMCRSKTKKARKNVSRENLDVYKST